LFDLSGTVSAMTDKEKKKTETRAIQVYTPGKEYGKIFPAINHRVRKTFFPLAIEGTKSGAGIPRDSKVIKQWVTFPDDYMMQTELSLEGLSTTVIKSLVEDSGKDWQNYLKRNLKPRQYKIFTLVIALVVEANNGGEGFITINQLCDKLKIPKVEGGRKYHSKTRNDIKQALLLLNKIKHTGRIKGKEGGKDTWYDIEQPLLNIEAQITKYKPGKNPAKKNISGRGFVIRIPELILQEKIRGQYAPLDWETFGLLDDKYAFPVYTWLIEYFRIRANKKRRDGSYQIERGGYIHRPLYDILQSSGLFPIRERRETLHLNAFHACLDSIQNNGYIDDWYITDQAGAKVSRDWYKERKFNRWYNPAETLRQYVYYFKIPEYYWDKVHQIKTGNGRAVIETEIEIIDETEETETKTA